MTSKPIGDNKPTPSGSGKSDVQPGHPKADISRAPGVTSLPPAQYHCEITCKQEKHWWDKWKPYVELFGVLLLAVYTGYTIKMYYANKDAANAATSAATTASQSLTDSQQSFRLENRPYVVIADPGVPYFLKSTNGKVSVVRLDLANIKYTNIGKTPAGDVFALARFKTWRYQGKGQPPPNITASRCKSDRKYGADAFNHF
jgi:hypothetical protein